MSNTDDQNEPIADDVNEPGEPPAETPGDVSNDAKESKTPPDRSDDISFTQAIKLQENPGLDHVE